MNGRYPGLLGGFNDNLYLGFSLMMLLCCMSDEATIMYMSDVCTAA